MSGDNQDSSRPVLAHEAYILERLKRCELIYQLETDFIQCELLKIEIRILTDLKNIFETLRVLG